MASSEEVKNETMRQFNSGATRNIDTERIDPEGFLAPSVLARYFEYMHKNRVQKNGQLRDSDNWQLGIPQRAYVKSMWRHFFDFWTRHRENGNHKSNSSPYRNDQLIEDCCALMFNSMGYMFEELKKPKFDENRDQYRKSEFAGLKKLLENGDCMIAGVNYPDGTSQSALVDKKSREVYYGKTISPVLRNKFLDDSCEAEIVDEGYGSGV